MLVPARPHDDHLIFVQHTYNQGCLFLEKGLLSDEGRPEGGEKEG